MGVFTFGDGGLKSPSSSPAIRPVSRLTQNR
jgi:hypothetical protein